MKFILTLTTILLTPILAICQTTDIDTKEVLNKVSRNFLLHRILNAEEHIKSYLSEDGYLSSVGDINFLVYLPPNGCELRLSLKKQDDIFPDSNFALYEVVKKLGLYICDKIVLDADLYPFDEDKRMLIAVHRETNQIIFISGNFFLQDIRHYFNFKIGVKEIERYLQLRDFMYGIDIVKFKNRRGRHYHFEGRNLSGKLIADMEVIMRKDAIQHINLKLW